MFHNIHNRQGNKSRQAFLSSDLFTKFILLGQTLRINAIWLKFAVKRHLLKLHRVNLQFFGAIFVGMLVTVLQQLKDSVTFSAK
jgi:hypothetical protein